MNNSIELYLKRGNCFGYFWPAGHGLLLGKITNINGDLVTFDNFQTPVDSQLVQRIRLTPANCPSFGWNRIEDNFDTFRINDESSIIFAGDKTIFAYSKEENEGMFVEIEYLDELQEAFRIAFPRKELPIKR